MASDYDPFSDEAMTDPTALYKAMRHEGCPHFIEQRDTWALTRFADVRAASLKSRNLDFRQGQTPGQLLLGEPAVESFATMNGADHRKWRGLIAHDFTLPAVKAQEPRYRALARSLWDGLKDREEIDVYGDLANRFFCINAGYKLGLPGEEAEEYRALIDDLLHREKGQVGAHSERNRNAAGALMEKIGAFVAKVRTEGDTKDSFTKLLSKAEVDGRSLSDHELVMWVITLLIVGSETTPMVIAAFFYYLDKHPDQKAAVLADKSLIRQAFMEAARFHQPTNMLARRAAEDFELSGRSIKAGQSLLFIYASANRDEAQFADADHFDIFRKDCEPNLTFGMGSHICLGMHVAVEAGTIIIEEILNDIADWSVIDEKVVRAYGEHLSGFIAMPIRLVHRSEQ